jgi:hypothetical protein
MADDRSSNGWSRYEEMVLTELRQLRSEVECIDDRLDKVRTEDLPQLRQNLASDMATAKAEMRFNARLWALLAGAIPIVLGIVYVLLGKHP